MRGRAERSRRIMEGQPQNFSRRERIRGTKHRPSGAASRGEEGADIRANVKRIVSQIIWIDDDGIHGDIREPRTVNVRPNRGSAQGTIHSLEDVAGWTSAAHGAVAKAGESH